MPVPVPSDADPADPEAISEAVDQLEERVVGHRVGTPRARNDAENDVPDQEQDGDSTDRTRAGRPPADVDRGPGTEPS